MYAVIDIGSNTIRLSLYQVTEGTITLLVNKKVTAGLAGYILDGRMSPEGIRRGEEALAELTNFLSYVQVQQLICFATAPLRGIDNADDVKARFEQVCHSPITILSGEEEAEIDFLGVKQHLGGNEGLVVDIGGGSTELVHYVEGEIRMSCSLPFGSLGMYRRYVSDIIPSADEMTRIMGRIEKELAVSGVPDHIPAICGVGGTVRGCGRLLRQILHDKEKAVRYMPDDIASLLCIDRQTLVARIIKEEPDRIHTILPGSCILLAVAKHCNAETIQVSPTGVREGCLINYLAQERK